MMCPELKTFFDTFGSEQPEISLPASTTLEENVRQLALHYHETILPGHGMFFDFSATPEYEKPTINYLTEYFGWTLEKPFFIRKPDHLKPCLLA